jgi:hypothetical protein
LARQANITIIPFKGAAITDTVYHNPGLRMYADMDILIKEQDLSRIKELLLGSGYLEKRQRYTVVFTKIINKGINSNLEIHTMFVPPRPYKVKIPELWGRTESKIIYSQKIQFLSKEDTFLSLAIHIRRHVRILLLKFVCDIAEFLNLYKETLDWEYIQNTANKNHIKNTVYFCLYISQELLNSTLSDRVVNIFKPGLLRKKLIHICMNKYNFLKPRSWQGYILRLLLFDRAADLFLYIWQVNIKERFLKQ